MDDYETQALRTMVSGNLHPNTIIPVEIYVRIRNVIEACEALDAVKKSLFYGKTYPRPAMVPLVGEAPPAPDGDVIIDLLHGAIGLATEAGEVLEVIAESVFNAADVDFAHLEEEMGDTFWYLAVLASHSTKTFSDIQQENIDKLKKRYPGKFTEAAALARADKA